jgi:hypothetical protein
MACSFRHLSFFIHDDDDDDDDDDSNLSTGRMFTATDVMQTVNRVSEMM